MAVKRFIPFGQSKTDHIVQYWMRKNGINEDLVSRYEIVRSADESIIRLHMHFDDMSVDSAEKEE